MSVEAIEGNRIRDRVDVVVTAAGISCRLEDDVAQSVFLVDGRELCFGAVLRRPSGRPGPRLSATWPTPGRRRDSTNKSPVATPNAAAIRAMFRRDGFLSPRSTPPRYVR